MYRLFLLLGCLGAFILLFYLEAAWWWPAPVAALLALVMPVWRRGGFYYAFLAGLIVWGGYAAYLHLANEGRLGDRLAETFGVASGYVLVLVTALWGGITAGLGGWFGAALRIGLRGGKT